MVTPAASVPVRVPSAAWYGVAALILIAGGVGLAVLMYEGLGSLSERLTRLVVPGEIELRLDGPGIYAIFHEYQSTVNGRLHSVPAVSGLLVSVRTLPAGEEVVLRSRLGAQYAMAGASGRSLFEFEVPSPGRYRLAASYAGGRREPQTVLAVGRDVMKDLVTCILTALASGLGGTVAAFLLALSVFLKRRKVKYPEEPT
jgi:hypothetical protein